MGKHIFELFKERSFHILAAVPERGSQYDGDRGLYPCAVEYGDGDHQPHGEERTGRKDPLRGG